MRLPNGFGSVYKLSGKRRRPWVARKTIDWTDNGHPKYLFVGYYTSKREAMDALAAYNQNPYDIDTSTLTFADVYTQWLERYQDRSSESTVRSAKMAYNICAPIHDIKIAEIKLQHLQQMVDDSGKNLPALKRVKSVVSMVFEFAAQREIVPPEKHEMTKLLDIKTAENPEAIQRTPFTPEEIEILWGMQNRSLWASVTLVLIYTGLRIGELLDLHQEDVHLDDRWLYVRKSKTKSGIREVPIADKILPIFQKWMRRDGEYILQTKRGFKIEYYVFRARWDDLMHIGSFQSHTAHDTRHTCISMLTIAGVDPRIIRAIVGHAGTGVTESVYTHIPIATKLDAINKI